MKPEEKQGTVDGSEAARRYDNDRDERDFGDRKELYRCLQCAICTGSCPSASVVEGYNPREIILRYILDGRQDEVIASELIWACTTCGVCRERCPHDIPVPGLLTTIMNMAARKGNLPHKLRAGIRLLAETGWAIQATSRTNRLRRELGLAPLRKRDAGAIRRVLHEAGIDEVLELK